MEEFYLAHGLGTTKVHKPGPGQGHLDHLTSCHTVTETLGGTGSQEPGSRSVLLVYNNPLLRTSWGPVGTILFHSKGSDPMT